MHIPVTQQFSLQTEATWVHISQDAAGCEAVSEQGIIWGCVLLLELRTSVKYLSVSHLLFTVSCLFLQRKISQFQGTGMEELLLETEQTTHHLLCLHQQTVMSLMVTVVSREGVPAPSSMERVRQVPAEPGNPLFRGEPPFPGRGPGGSTEFPVLPVSQASPGRCPALPGEGSRASLSSGGCWKTPEPQTVAKGKEAKQDLESTGCNRS